MDKIPNGPDLVKLRDLSEPMSGGSRILIQFFNGQSAREFVGGTIVEHNPDEATATARVMGAEVILPPDELIQVVD